jgi:hypothetical protein
MVILSVTAGACGMEKPFPSGGADSESPGPPPVPIAQLNAVYTSNAGLLLGVGMDGYPATSGPNADPQIQETLRFYDTVQTPFPQDVTVDYPDPFTGAPTTMRRTAPLTLDAWKEVFGFSKRNAGESLSDYRDRTGISVYYNRNELGLGRELGCSRFLDGYGADGAALYGIACWVTNYGSGLRQGALALQATLNGTEVRNTVCITYRPTLGPGYEVQFYVYAPDGARQEWARLDTLGPRPHPQICMTCHGGGYDPDRHLAKNARFLPLDPSAVLFAQGAGVAADVTRAGQEERIRAVNFLATTTPLTSAQQALLNNLYGGAITTMGATATGDGVPDAWRTTAVNSEFYRGVVRPYCSTCHMAAQRGLADTDLASYAMFASPAAFDAAPLEAYVCNTFSMPNAQPTSLGFWDAQDNPGVTVGGRLFATAADALFARRGSDRASCTGLADVSGCNRGKSPDALCGGAVSGGAVCDATTDRCVPTVMQSGSVP